MLLYLRRIKENRSEDIGVQKTQANLGQLEKYNNRFVYSVEKLDEDFGVFSYSIGKLGLEKLDKNSAELYLFPNTDKEWTAQAKKIACKILLEKAFQEFKLKEVYVFLEQDKKEEREILCEIGFASENRSGQIKEHYVHQDKEKFFIKNCIKILVTGVTGKLGYDVIRELALRQYSVVGCSKADSCKIERPDTKQIIPYIFLDITDEESVVKVMEHVKPDAVIHCSAWTAVDDAELEKNKKEVYAINVEGTRNLAKACKDYNAKLMYITTDYAFDGTGEAPWSADCYDFAPLNYYGKTKLQGEQEITKILKQYFIVRTEWAFGANGRNFVDVLLETAKKRNQITVVDDQIGSPTFFYDLAKLLADMIVTEKYGYYNAVNSGEYVSRYQYAKEIFRQAAEMGYQEYSLENLTVDAVSTAEYSKSRAVRPLNSRLDQSKLMKAGFVPLPDWKDALARYLRGKLTCSSQ